ncbi:hypothetical protein, partial [Amycolatopsis sp. CA-126428]|uniref:hypothetical protein n=1 Tax=Amycolatopsis sp. CA-126428 TaxID=2073158 RepID=UPI001E5D48DF
DQRPQLVRHQPQRQPINHNQHHRSPATDHHVRHALNPNPNPGNADQFAKRFNGFDYYEQQDEPFPTPQTHNSGTFYVDGNGEYR